jgi:hypothetical protein
LHDVIIHQGTAEHALRSTPPVVLENQANRLPDSNLSQKFFQG